jgi:hypothetical protein
VQGAHGGHEAYGASIEEELATVGAQRLNVAEDVE